MNAATLPLDTINVDTHDPTHTIQDGLISTPNPLVNMEPNFVLIPDNLEDGFPVISMDASSNINLDDSRTSMSTEIEMEDDKDSHDGMEEHESNTSMSGGTDIDA